MASKDEDQKDGSDKEPDKESRPTTEHDSDNDEGELTPVRPKKGEPPGNLRRRADWFQKRH